MSWVGRGENDSWVNLFQNFQHLVSVFGCNVCFLSVFIYYDSVVRDIQCESLLFFQSNDFLYFKYVDGTVFEVADTEIFIGNAVFYVINTYA